MFGGPCRHFGIPRLSVKGFRVPRGALPGCDRWSCPGTHVPARLLSDPTLPVEPEISMHDPPNGSPSPQREAVRWDSGGFGGSCKPVTGVTVRDRPAPSRGEGEKGIYLATLRVADTEPPRWRYGVVDRVVDTKPPRWRLPRVMACRGHEASALALQPMRCRADIKASALASRCR